MKFLDGVVLTVDRPEYEKQGLKKGMKGTIVIAEIRQETFEVEYEYEGERLDKYVSILFPEQSRLQLFM